PAPPTLSTLSLHDALPISAFLHVPARGTLLPAGSIRPASGQADRCFPLQGVVKNQRLSSGTASSRRMPDVGAPDERNQVRRLRWLVPEKHHRASSIRSRRASAERGAPGRPSALRRDAQEPDPT